MGLPEILFRCIEFMSRAILIMIVNFVLTLIATNADNPGYKLYREVKFTSQQVNSTKVCSTQNPDFVIKQARSSIECAVICKGTEGCTGVNWKKPSTCELYGTKPTTFVVAPSCTYLNSGKEY